ncbi:MAG: DUF58 domain-containing protein [Phycisphaerales bacterium]
MAARRDSLSDRAQRAAAGDLPLRAGALVEGLYAGAHRAIERGGAGEFIDHRDYAPGDAPARIDWKLAARSDRLQVRRRRSEAQATALVALDASASMGFGEKWRIGQELAAALAIVAVRQGERAGVIVSSGARVEAGAGWTRAQKVVAAIERSRPAGEMGLGAALATAAQVRPRPSIVLGVGDALEEAAGIIEACARLRFGEGGRASDVRIVQVVAPEELDVAAFGAARFTDPEGGGATRAVGQRVAGAYRERVRAHLDETHERLAALGVRHTLARTDGDLGATLRAVCEARRH